MRPRFTMSACAAAALACAATPSLAAAATHRHAPHAPHTNRALTITATPRTIIAGEPVVISGRLEGRSHANQVIHLWHRINPQRHFTIIGTTRTDANGNYRFTRAENVVNSNRSWFVRGPVFTHSRTIHERVAAEVTLSSNATAGTTRHAFTFTGHVTPDHAGERVALQVQRGNGNSWNTIKTARLGRGSSYAIHYAWRTPGARSVRVRFSGDGRNTAAASDVSSIVVDQHQAPYFTISSSDSVAANGAPVTISGTLYRPHTTVGDAGVPVALVTGAPGTSARSFTVVQQTTTAADGGYRFTVAPNADALYQVRTLTSPPRATSVLFEGIQDSVTMNASAAASQVGHTVTFAGAVAPSKAGDIIYLQKLGRDGQWHTVKTTRAGASSTFTFSWTFGAAGTKRFRARILGDDANVGGASAPVAVTVTEPPLSSTPTG